MKRNKNLHPLSWEHHHTLTSVVLTRRHIKNCAPRARLVQIAREFAAFHREALLPHFRHEEEWLLPRYLRHASAGDAAVTRLLREHVTLHRLVYDLALAERNSADLVAPLTALTDALEAHVRFEEREMFPMIEAVLTADELSSLGEELLRSVSDAVVIPGGDGCRVKAASENAPLPDSL